VRAFPNLYPAIAHHEVVAEGAEHTEHPAELRLEVWRDVLTVWRRRIAWLERQDGVRCAFLFKNVGRLAGASIAHNHSQLLGLPMLPPRLELELANARRDARCLHCRELESAAAAGRVVHGGAHHVVFCPSTPKLPLETWIAPVRHDHDFVAGDHDDDLAAVMLALFRALDAAFRRAPFNLFLHRVPGEDFHWHFELQPRMGNLAGLEVGGDMYMNALTGADAAGVLRAALASG
jgi:UDPglucose--hexose-1-phosphate uridylyltransferase